MGLAVLGAPVGRAQSRMAANDASAGSTSNATATPAASNPADLDRRIEALESELSELRIELAAKKTAEPEAAAAAAPAAAPQDKPAEKVSVASLLGPTSVSGFVDVYYQGNINHPADRGADFRAFDFRSNQFALNMVQLILDKAPDASGPAGRTGYHVALGFGDGMNTVNATDPGGLFAAQYLKEAYFSYLAPIGKGLQVDVGKYVTPMGSEVIESKDNWNYSRGLLFTYAIPFYHFGARAKYTFNDKYALTGYFANGWNNIVDNNSGKMYGMTFNWNPTKKVSFAQTYMAGPEQTTGTFGPTISGGLVNVNSDWRQTWDTAVTYNPTAKWSFMANFDYGRGDRTVTDNETTPFTLSPPVFWTGGAAYAKYAWDDKDYVAARYEYFDDHDGFTTASSVPGFPSGGSLAPFQHVHYNEITATYQRAISTHLLTRLEYRRDMASLPVFDFSNFPAGVKYQNTATIGLIFLFDSRDAK